VPVAPFISQRARLALRQVRAAPCRPRWRNEPGCSG